MNHAPEIVKVVFPSGRHASEALQPGKEAFNLPPSSISSQRPSILGLWSFPPPSVRCDHLNAQGGQLRVQGVAIVGFVPNDPIRELHQKPAFQGLTDQFHFMRRSAVHVEGDRKTMAVRNCHDFRSFPPFRFPHPRPPFFAGEKVPSMKASLRSRPPRSRRSSAKANKISSKTPSWDHFWCQRWHVDLGGYRAGRSCHWAPVRSIHKIPLSTSRGYRWGRPRGSDRLDGIRGSNTCHCSSVKSIWLYKTRFYQMSRLFLG